MRNFFLFLSSLFARRDRRASALWRREVEPEEIFVDAALAFRDPIAHTERALEAPLGRLSSFLFLAIALGGIVYLGGRGFFLQVASGNVLFSRSQDNRFLKRTIYAPRGIIRDRIGMPLVFNAPLFGLSFSRAGFMDGKGDAQTVVRTLAKLLGRDAEFFYGLGFPRDGDPRALPARMVLAEDLTREQVVILASQSPSLPGVEIFESYRRSYPDSYAFSHALGVGGKMSPEDLRLRPELGAEESVGKSGIEAFYDDLLRGSAGQKIVEADSRGVETNFRMTREPRQGGTLALTLDGGLQKIAYELLKRYTGGSRGASVIAIDPRNGAVRTLVSFPGFDAGKFGQGLHADEFDAILRDPMKPLFNRAIAGEFPSGSTIKPLIAAAALEEGIIDPEKKIYDPGFLDIPNPYRPGAFTRFPDWRPQGWVNMADAIAYSANVYFYVIGGGYRDQKGLGIEKIRRYAAAFGLGERLGIDLAGEKPGLVPGPDWKKTAEPRDPDWRIGDTYHVAIGQGGFKATPLQMVSLTASIANGGTLWRPYLLDRVYDADGAVIRQGAPSVIRRDLASRNTLAIVAEGMRDTVLRGTARLLGEVPVPVAAKTGTAQNAPGKAPHAWVTAYAPADHPEIAIVVMVEHAGEGATVAVPITNEILKWYFAHRSGCAKPQCPNRNFQ